MWQNPGFEGGVLLPRVGIFGWGVVAPRSPNIDRFAENLGSTESWLETFNGYGPDNFLVGLPEFRFADPGSACGSARDGGPLSMDSSTGTAEKPSSSAGSPPSSGRSCRRWPA